MHLFNWKRNTDNEDKDAKVIKNENTTDSTTFDMGDGKKESVFLAMISDPKVRSCL